MKRNFLGIDVGSVAIGVCEVAPEKKIHRSAYRFHRGKIAETLLAMLADFDMANISTVAASTSTPEVIRAEKRYDNQVALIAAVKHLHENARGILNVGGERFSLIEFDENGHYLNCRSNTSCAAGTGSFLDQQALRLDLAGSEELSEAARLNTSSMPKIASRCAVFAKTDLIHAQQEGYSLFEICDGLCFGLAKNIVDTLFCGRDTASPIVFTGGVSRNFSVVRHVENLIEKEIIIDMNSHVFGAYGAGLCLIDEGLPGEMNIAAAQDVIFDKPSRKHYFYEGLDLKQSEYPDFSGGVSYVYPVKSRKIPSAVEVEVYEEPSTIHPHDVYLGVDIGSTSTKAVVMDRNKRVLAGFYTWTSGRPVDAFCALCEAIDDLIRTKGITLNIIGSGTTGSGRKLIGNLTGADLILDEITAHARAAAQLNPDVDTIIEIGGQDSKFTTLSRGRVTFSIMNTVCAAGTGSFIEEQARKMGCPLDEYSRRTLGVRSPVSSDRCTVFMERDMNHYLSEGYGADEVLASALHSVCENYLTKVAVEGSIGSTIFFQGATARNKALVAAFEQRLGKPIYVSRFCHVTGALGVALQLADDQTCSRSFSGLDLYTKSIPVRSEVCSLCANHCKLTVTEVDGKKSAYGFLCGRDYDTGRYVNNNTSGFDLLAERSKIEKLPHKSRYERTITIGIPSALHLFEDMNMWKCFFDELSIKTVSSSNFRDAIKQGKNLAGAEFCAPVTALHGHVRYLLEKADYVFVPYYLEQRQKKKGIRRQYCYYTQFAPSLVSALDGRKDSRVLTPLVNYLYNRFHTKLQLYRMLKRITAGEVTLMEVSAAFDKAVKFKEACGEKLQECYENQVGGGDAISVVLLGRPYTALSPFMNKGIVDIFAAKGIKVFFQDMVACSQNSDASLAALIDDIPWKYAARILQTASEVAGKKGVYPVLVTSFRCSPDSFAVDYFKKIMNAHDKPYLILQLDEHDSSVGYETRIEAAIRSFSNHFSSCGDTGVKEFPSIIPGSSLSRKTILFPNWDPFSCPLIVASLQREGLDVRLLEEQHTSIARSLRYNTGQCIPINIMAQEYIDYMEKYGLDPARCILWMANGQIACNLKLIPHHIMSTLCSYGHGMEKAEVYQGNIALMDISLKAAVNAYFAFMFGGMLRRIVCRVRPYEREKGHTDRAMKDSLRLFAEAFAGRMSKEDALRIMVHDFENIQVKNEDRPKAAIFGDLYVRDNDLMNQDLVRFIENNGGEVITTPYSTYAKMIARPYFRKWLTEGKYIHTISAGAVFSTLLAMENRYYRYFQQILNEPDHIFSDSTEEILAKYRLIPEHTGESMDNILKIHYIKKFYPDVALFIQTSPAFCCASLVTEAMAGQIESITGVPIVNITYDGTFGNRNKVIIPYLAYPRRIPFSNEAENIGAS